MRLNGFICILIGMRKFLFVLVLLIPSPVMADELRDLTLNLAIRACLETSRTEREFNRCVPARYNQIRLMVADTYIASR